jgi:predicted O-methyltransferase YrrM
MNLTNSQRLQKLARDLMAQPRNVPRYVRHNVLARRTPIDLGLPWFSYGAIDFLERFLRPEMSVFEFGCGGSTLFFAPRCATVRCVEDDAQWAALVRQRLSDAKLGNVTIVEHAFDFRQSASFERSQYLAEVRSGKFDVIVVDGQDEDYTIRPRCFAAAEEQVNPGGIVVVDDSWRYRQLRTNHRAKRVEVFETVGPARFGVTSTDVYFY